MNVDYKNAEQFESIARSEGFHDLDVMGNGCYADDFLQHFYLGWQASRQALSSCSEIPNSSGHASRQALEGEPVAIVDRVGIMQRCAPYTNLEEGTKLYTRPASESKGRIEGDKSGYGRIADSSGNKQAVSVPEWIKCSDRLPAEYDGDYEGLVWVNDRDMTLPKYAQSRLHWSRVREIAGYTHWMPTGFRRPQPPKQEQSHD